MKSISKIKSSSIVAITAILLCIAAAFAMLANFAFAEEGEANACPEVTVSVLPDSSFESFCTITKGHPSADDTSLICSFPTSDRVFYVKGDFSGNEVCKIAVLDVGLPEGYRFMGFYIDDQIIKDNQVITENSEIQVMFAINRLECSAQDYSSQPSTKIVDYTFSLYDKNHNLVESKNTSSNAICIFWNIDLSLCPYAVLGHKDGYTDCVEGLISDDLTRLPYYMINTPVAPLESTMYSIHSNSDAHNYFNMHMIGHVSTRDTSKDAFCIGVNRYVPLMTPRMSDSFTVNDDNTLLEKYVMAADVAWTENTYTPVPVEGRNFSHWIVDDGTGLREAMPGETFNVGEAKITFEAVYDEPPQPGPEPTPTPTEEINAAQTGDNNILAIAAFAIVALAGGTTLIIRNRKDSHEIH